MLLYNEVRDLTAELLTDDVETHLQPFNNETFYYKTANIQDSAHLDFSMNDFWGGSFEKCYTDIRVFNPPATSKNRTNLQTTYRKSISWHLNAVN